MCKALASGQTMNLPTKYILDVEGIKLNSYKLIALFYANKEIARSIDPEERDGVAKLEDKYFFSEMSKLLIEIAISIRVLDDQMKSLPPESEIKTAYNSAIEATNKRHSCMMFDELSLRETCNKIIHANVVEPHIEESENGDHQIDRYNWLGWSEAVEYSEGEEVPKPDPIKWKYLTNNIRLGGKKGKKQWWYLLQVPVFVEAISGFLG
jgi:hypothetical protein